MYDCSQRLVLPSRGLRNCLLPHLGHSGELLCSLLDSKLVNMLLVQLMKRPDGGRYRKTKQHKRYTLQRKRKSLGLVALGGRNKKDTEANPNRITSPSFIRNI